MIRRWLTCVLALGLVGGVALCLLSDTSQSPGAQQDQNIRQRQANELREFAQEQFLEHCPRWSPEYAPRYADAVRDGILLGSEAPLPEWKIQDLRAVITHGTEDLSREHDLEPCRECAIASTKFHYAFYAGLPKPTPAEETQITQQIHELGAFLEQQVMERLVQPLSEMAKADAQKPAGLDDCAAAARDRFEEWATKAHQQPWSTAFKRPLSGEELEGIRSRFLEWPPRSTSRAVLKMMARVQRPEQVCRAMSVVLYQRFFGAVVGAWPHPEYPSEVQKLRHECGEARREQIREEHQQRP